MDGWVLFGLSGQLFFGSRFFIQWFLSEIRKKSYVPTIFWYLSALGGILLFIYAIHIKDVVFIIGQGAGICIYFRNIILIRRNSYIGIDKHNNQ